MLIKDKIKFILENYYKDIDIDKNEFAIDTIIRMANKNGFKNIEDIEVIIYKEYSKQQEKMLNMLELQYKDKSLQLAFI